MIRFCLVAVPLQIGFFRNVGPSISMMTSFYSFNKAESDKKASQIFKADVCVGLALKDPLVQLLKFVHPLNLSTFTNRFTICFLSSNRYDMVSHFRLCTDLF